MRCQGQNCLKYERDGDRDEEASFFKEAQQKQRELADRARDSSAAFIGQ
jgi:hypothetical protein